MLRIFKILPVVLLGLAPFSALAHCPLCTAGAATAALLALGLGISPAPIAIFVGAFAIAAGLWAGRLLKKNYIPRQKEALAALSYVATIVPLMPIMSDYRSISVFLVGDYGSLLNRTYLINLFIFGSIIGGVIVATAPRISKLVTKLRNNLTLPYQGIMITFLLLMISAVVIELLV